MKTVFIICDLICFLAFSIAIIRLIKGPTSLNRVLALDVLTLNGLGVLILFCLKYKDAMLLDILLVYSILPFVGTVAFSIYSERYLKGKGHQYD